MKDWIEIIAPPEVVWDLLQPDRWTEWLAADGPFPPLVSLQPQPRRDGYYLAEAADGQTSDWKISLYPDQRVMWCVVNDVVGKSPWPTMQIHQITLASCPQGTELVWNINSNLAFSFYKRLLASRSLNRSIKTMQEFSLINLKELAELEARSSESE